MRVALKAAGLAALIFLSAGVGRPQSAPNTSGTPEGGGAYEPRKPVLIVSDNQEHLLTGAPLRAMGTWMDRLVSSVAVRSPLANVGGRLLFREALRFGRARGAELVLHMGDAADISCPDELTAVFEALEAETPGVWFMAPGNHDGLLAGNFAGYQPRFDYKVKELPSFYESRPGEGYGEYRHQWLYACMSPSPENYKNECRGNVLTRGDFIQHYLGRLRRRAGARSRLEPMNVVLEPGGGRKLTVTCTVEELEIKSLNYSAIARVCPRVEVDEGSGGNWVGPYSSFIVQKIDVGGTPVVMVDTSDYYKATALTKVLFKGELTDCQKVAADLLIEREGAGREDLIIAGHHRLHDLNGADRRWVAERAGRYLSGHAHYSASLFEHDVGDWKTRELNVGSTLDHPAQAVIAHIGPRTAYFRVAGGEEKTKGWGGEKTKDRGDDYLQKCMEEDDEDRWNLGADFYKSYRRHAYVRHLLTALRVAAARHDEKLASSSPAPKIPTGEEAGDWLALDKALRDINNSEGESRAFWACQAYYASKATGREKSLWEKLGIGVKKGSDATGGWVKFETPPGPVRRAESQDKAGVGRQRHVAARLGCRCAAAAPSSAGGQAPSPCGDE